MMATGVDNDTPVEQDLTSNLNQVENDNQNTQSTSQTQGGDLRNRHSGARAHHANRQTIQELEHQQQEEEESKF